jgi:voltage-gated potassium channel Kch
MAWTGLLAAVLAASFILFELPRLKAFPRQVTFAPYWSFVFLALLWPIVLAGRRTRRRSPSMGWHSMFSVLYFLLGLALALSIQWQAASSAYREAARGFMFLPIPIVDTEHYVESLQSAAPAAEIAHFRHVLSDEGSSWGDSCLVDAYPQNGSSGNLPHRTVFLHHGIYYALICASSALLFVPFFVLARVISLLLADVADDRVRYSRRLRAYRRYHVEFLKAVLTRHPLLIMTLLLTISLALILPLVLAGTHRELLPQLLGADQVILAFGLLSALLSPMLLAATQVSETYSMYFSVELASTLTTMAEHTIVLGYADLGEKAVAHELRIQREFRPLEYRGFFRPIVTPDLDIEYLATRVVVVDDNPELFAHMSRSDSLGSFGVIKCPDPANPQVPGESLFATEEILIPTLSGDATEPYTLSRVNLDHARFLIITAISQTHIRDTLQVIQDSEVIPCITATPSHQLFREFISTMENLPIIITFPAYAAGLSLGERLQSAVLSLERARAARVLVVGNSLETDLLLQHVLRKPWAQQPQVRRVEVDSSCCRYDRTR